MRFAFTDAGSVFSLFVFGENRYSLQPTEKNSILKEKIENERKRATIKAGHCAEELLAR